MKLGRRVGAVVAGAAAVAGVGAALAAPASAAPVPLPGPQQVAPQQLSPWVTPQWQPVWNSPWNSPQWQPRLRGPQVSPWLREVDAGETERVAVRLRGLDRRVCNVKVYVSDTSRVDVSYPGWQPYASLRNGPTLTLGERDSATVLVLADDARRDYTERLQATVTYDGCGWNARTQVKRVSLLLPVDVDGPQWNRPGNRL